jgi:transcriptional regulator with XRE-family HTH domain
VNAQRPSDTPPAGDADAAPNRLTLALAANLVAARQAAGISQRELAAKSGLARTYLRRIEAGEANVGLGVLMILARVVNVSASDLIQLAELNEQKES